MKNWNKIRVKGKKYFVFTRSLALLIGFILGFIIYIIKTDGSLFGIIGILLGWGLGSYFWLPYKWDKEENNFINH